MSLVRIPNPDYATHPAYGRLFGRPRFSTRVAALKRFLPYFFKYRRMLFHDFNQRVRSTFLLTQKLYENGALGFHLDDAEIQRLTARAASYIADIEQGKKEISPDERRFKHKIRYINPKKDPEFYGEVTTILDKREISKIASLYRGRRMEFTDLFVQVGDVDDPDLKNYFSDVPLPDPPTSYFHIDASEGQVKCMIYLSHVTNNNGPFSYVIGSNRNHIGKLELITRIANDKSRLDKCQRANRELFWALPKVLRKKAEFGNDLDPTSPDAHALLSREHAFTSEDGNLIMFDNNGYHRGRVTREGRRVVLQIAYKPHGYIY